MILHIYCGDTVTVFKDILFDEFEQLKGCFPFSNHIKFTDIHYAWVPDVKYIKDFRNALKTLRFNNAVEKLLK